MASRLSPAWSGALSRIVTEVAAAAAATGGVGDNTARDHHSRADRGDGPGLAGEAGEHQASFDVVPRAMIHGYRSERRIPDRPQRRGRMGSCRSTEMKP